MQNEEPALTGQTVAVTETPKNFCVEGGYLIGGDYNLMGAPHQYMFDRLKNVVGCSRLRCDDCNAMVVSAIGLELSEGVKAGDVYWKPGETPPSGLVIPARWTDQRLYCCHCTARQEMNATSAQPSPPYDYGDPPPLNWRCAGHPELPRHLEGRDQLAAAEELLVSSPVEGEKYRGADELGLMLRSADVELHGALLGLLREVLTSGEGLRLARALGATVAEPGAFIDQFASVDPEHIRFREADATRGGWTLRERLSHALGECIVNAPMEAWAWCRLQEMAKKLMDGTKSIKLVEAICKYDAFHVAHVLTKMNGAT